MWTWTMVKIANISCERVRNQSEHIYWSLKRVAHNLLPIKQNKNEHKPIESNWKMNKRTKTNRIGLFSFEIETNDNDTTQYKGKKTTTTTATTNKRFWRFLSHLLPNIHSFTHVSIFITFLFGFRSNLRTVYVGVVCTQYTLTHMYHI